MKKLLSVILAFVMALSLVACGAKEEEPVAPSTGGAATEAPAEEAAAPAEA